MISKQHMITPDLNDDGYTGNILIEPNRPISWQDNLRFIRVFALVSIILAIGFMYAGILLVLPFSGLEILCLALALYFVYRHYSVCQVIYFTRDSIIIESGKDHAIDRIEYQRYWSSFHVEDEGNYNIPRLTIRSREKSTEIGGFLNYADKIQLIQIVKKLTKDFQFKQPLSS